MTNSPRRRGRHDCSRHHFGKDTRVDILMVMTSHDRLGDSGAKTGIWLEEFAAPYYIFTDAKAAITLASPKGGRPPIDPDSEKAVAQTAATNRLCSDDDALKALGATITLADLDSAAPFSAIFYVGGHGPMWDLAEGEHSIALLEDATRRGIPIGAVCHGPAAFRHVLRPDGEPLVCGRAVTGFSNREEEANGTVDVVPFLLEDMLVENGGLYTSAPDWQPHVEHDGSLITGQNPASSEATARQLLAVIDVRKVLAPVDPGPVIQSEPTLTGR